MSAEVDRMASFEAGRRIIVAIDGPAGAGKSTIARHLARHFGLLNLETGAMYRAFALKALREEIPLDDSPALERLTHETSILLESGEDENRVLLDGEDVSGLIRNPTVTEAASRVSVFPPVRAWMVRQQQELAAQGGVVMEGRDIGTVVFPKTPYKFFLDADADVRAQRRSQQGENDVIRERDVLDQQRQNSPLTCAPDALRLDSGCHTVEELVATALEHLTALGLKF
jgi:cytidylate kinase